MDYIQSYSHSILVACKRFYKQQGNERENCKAGSSSLRNGDKWHTHTHTHKYWHILSGEGGFVPWIIFAGNTRKCHLT